LHFNRHQRRVRLLCGGLQSRRLRGLEYIMILGSVLAVCVCCCKGGGEPQREWNWQQYLACIRRCWLATVVLMVSLAMIELSR